MSLLSGIIPYLVAAGGALLVIWKLWASGKQAGVDQQKAKEAIQRAQDIERVRRANEAGAGVRPDDPGVQYDPHNRDTWFKRKT